MIRFNRLNESEDVYEVYSDNRYIGMVSSNGGLWAATWNMVPSKDDHRYCHSSKEDAANELKKQFEQVTSFR